MSTKFGLSWVRRVAFLCLTAVLVFYAGTSYASGCKAPAGRSPGLKRFPINVKRSSRARGLYTLSSTMAMPWPTPMHMVQSA